MESGKSFPSLRLGYDLVSGCLHSQRDTARNYTNRALNILSLASAILAIGLAIGFNNIQIQHIWINPLVKIFSILSIVLYIILVRFVYLTIKPKPITVLDNPSGLEDELLSLNQDDFYKTMIDRIKEAYEKNEERLRLRADYLTVLIPLFILQTLSVVGTIIVFAVF